MRSAATARAAPAKPKKRHRRPKLPATSTSQNPTLRTPLERQTRFIARLSYEDAADWGAGLSSNLAPSVQNLAAVSASVSPDGRYLAFMSEENLTGYDNRDAVGGEADEEVYLYDSLARPTLLPLLQRERSGRRWRSRVQTPDGHLRRRSGG